MNDSQSNQWIYLDHNATTPLCAEAVQAMSPFLAGEFGNPSSGYPLGMRAKEAVERAREAVASLLGADREEVVFTSGGSESNNMVLKGVVDFRTPEKAHIIISAVEHPAIVNPAVYLMELGVQVSILPVDGHGRIDPDLVRRAIRPDTVLISIMQANNETGTLQPLSDISWIAREHGIPLHTDAAQAVGKIKVNVAALGVDYLTVAGHKLYGPKGVGALYIKRERSLTPLIHGAAQESGKRAGTENTILAAGLGAAARAAEDGLDTETSKMEAMRDLLEMRLFEGIPGLVLNGHPMERLPNTLNVSVPNLEGGKILDGIPQLMASTGAACHDRTVSLSHVLSAMGVPPEIGMGALRLTVGRLNTMEQMEAAAGLIVDQVDKLRKKHGRSS
ncbi:MAG: cysteine desulfurase [Deltaproteobacteria bacterium]|nr:cysteine desulfurase [Deltaproteobacteria bacterium]MBW2284217.1 cysteine desulfurase [Deltaproteobacteria bacterium]